MGRGGHRSRKEVAKLVSGYRDDRVEVVHTYISPAAM